MCVVCFSIGNGPRRHWPPSDAASQFLLNQYYCYWAPATRHHGAMFTTSACLLIKCTITNLHCCAASSATFTNLQCAPHQVQHSLISTVCLIKCTLTNLQCVPHQVQHSLISTVHLHQVHRYQSPVCTTPSATFTNVHCVPSTCSPFTNLQCYASTSTNLHCCSATVAAFYSVAPFVSYYFMWLCYLSIMWLCDYATRQFYIINNLAADVNTP